MSSYIKRKYESDQTKTIINEVLKNNEINNSNLYNNVKDTFKIKM